MTTSGGGGSGAGRGHRFVDHTADTILEVWAPTFAGLLAEAVAGLVEVAVDTGGSGPPSGEHTFTVPAGPVDEALLAALEEVIFVVDTTGSVPATVSVTGPEPAPVDGTGRLEEPLTVTFGLVPLSAVEVVGPAPKAVTRHALEVDHHGGRWHARIVIDV